jgi:hypothetical protein
MPAHDSHGPPLRVRPFLAVYVACALLFQLGGATPSWGPSSSLEAFSAGLLGMLAALCLVLMRRAAGWHRLFWLVSCLALALLGLDEFFELHESTALGRGGNAEALKVALWIGAAGALFLVLRFERPTRAARLAMCAGYGLHTLYLVAELGDGGAYRLPIGEGGLRVAEDLLELAMLTAYLFAFGSLESEPEGAVDVADEHVCRDRAA